MPFADLVAVGGRVHTLDPAGRVVEGLAVHAGRIVALGARADLDHAVGAATRVVDLDGRTVIPGIVDSHCHPDTYAIRMAKWRDLGPDVIQGRDALLTAVSDAASQAAADAWFVGYRFNERLSGGYPTLAELDQAGHGHPVFILRTDAHLGLANSAAFAACGIGPGTPDPAFGRFDREPGTGRLTGLVRETAAHVFLDRIHATDTEEEIAQGMERVFDRALELGITSLYNSLTPSRAIRAYQAMKRAGRMRVRMGVIASGREPGLVEAMIAAGMQTGFGDDLLRLIGVEWCPDCSTSGRTAAYYEPYVGQPVLGEPQGNRGMLLYAADDLKRRAVAAHQAGLLVCIEGVGDRGIDFALDAIEAALEARPAADHRMRVEHCCYVTPAGPRAAEAAGGGGFVGDRVHVRPGRRLRGQPRPGRHAAHVAASQPDRRRHPGPGPFRRRRVPAGPLDRHVGDGEPKKRGRRRPRRQPGRDRS